MVLLWFLMQGIHRHYQSVSDELAVGSDEPAVLPSRVHSIVLVSKLHRPALQALAYARATRPSTLEAVTVAVDPDEARALADEWERRRIPVPLKVLDSPFREITRPVVEYVYSLRTANPRELVTVFLPEYVVGRWWEQLLHNQSALRLRTRLRFTSGVVVTSVPYLLASGEAAKRSLRARSARSRGGAATLVNLVRTGEVGSDLPGDIDGPDDPAAANGSGPAAAATKAGPAADRPRG
jgi:hypothetical protein